MTQDRTNRRTEAWLGRADGRLASRLRFLLEADKLKTVIRGSRIADGSRPENTAEHSWHIALFALVLAPHAAEPIDLLRVVSMLLIHDLVEIDSGDTPLFDPAGAATQAGREAAAVDRLYGLLPGDQAAAYRALWDEFEAAETADARFAKAIDRLQPILLNHAVGGGTWTDYDVDEARERSLTSRIADGSPALWAAAEAVIGDAVERGWLKPASRAALSRCEN
jgi:putative hydrolase of HD superfamily